eukprot:scaffold29047_cov43-Cyclotella_meneghiniana.AAC.4
MRMTEMRRLWYARHSSQLSFQRSSKLSSMLSFSEPISHPSSEPSRMPSQSNKYYMNFGTWKCFRDCAAGSGFDCAQYFKDEWFEDKNSCCIKYVLSDYEECMKAN